MIQRLAEDGSLERIVYALCGNSFSRYEAQKDFENYKLYQLQKFDKFSEDDIINMKILDILFKLGFSYEEIGTYLYKDLIFETYKRLSEEEDKEKLLSDLTNAFSNLYFYIAREWKDLGIKPFHLYIERAIGKIESDEDIIENSSDYGTEAFKIASSIKEKADYKKPLFKRLSNMTNDFKLDD